MSKEKPELLVANSKGKIYNLPDVGTTGMKGGLFFRLRAEELIELPSGSELFMLPDRVAVGYDWRTKNFVELSERPVACFVSPGFTVSYNSAYREEKKAALLPLFAYAAVAFYRNKFYVAACRVDRQRRQDLRLMNMKLVKKNVVGFKKMFAGNRLIRQLGNCALVYGCPAAKNFFLQRYEAPLPTSPVCNASCIGCISLQARGSCSVTQPRITFVPTALEIAELALFHIKNVVDPVISFGQGCEGEPLLKSGLLEEAIRLIRQKTDKGTINLNTNASRPKALAKLFTAGLDSIRVSLNSARAKYYNRYFRPQGYAFKDVLNSIGIAKKSKKFVSVNYLTMPGFTDLNEEFKAFKNFIETQRIDMIQWRSLNFDPLYYFRTLKVKVSSSRMLGIKEIISGLKQEFPSLLMGYFNPSRLRISRHNLKAGQ